MSIKNRGFASMTPEKQKAIASMGGKAAHASGHSHEFTSEEASAAAKVAWENRRARARQAARDAGKRVPEDDEAYDALDQD